MLGFKREQFHGIREVFPPNPQTIPCHAITPPTTKNNRVFHRHSETKFDILSGHLRPTLRCYKGKEFLQRLDAPKTSSGNLRYRLTLRPICNKMFQQSRTRLENDYYIGQSSGLYDELRFYQNPAVELDFSSLDVDAFTKNSSVYKNQSPKTQANESRKSPPEPMSYIEETDACGKLYRSTSRRMKRLVALNSILSVLTLICLGFTSFVYYNVLIKSDGGNCKGCNSDSPLSGKCFE